MRKRFKMLPKMVLPMLSVVCLLLATTTAVFAWFVMPERLSRTEELDIDIPPVIYIKNDNLQEITTFKLDGLRIGEEYNTVFCVSPALIGSVENFFLGVIYTENLGMNINLYPVSFVATTPADGLLHEERDIALGGGTKTTCYFNFKTSPDGNESDAMDGYQCKVTYGNWTNETKPGPGNLNNGVYKAYSDLEFSETGTSSADLIDKLNDKQRYRFFILNITWDPDSGTENNKETDIVYIVSNGKKT